MTLHQIFHEETNTFFEDSENLEEREQKVKHAQRVLCAVVRAALAERFKDDKETLEYINQRLDKILELYDEAERLQNEVFKKLDEVK